MGVGVAGVMAERMQQKGELFSRLYIERGAPTQDSAAFRKRLVAFLENHSPVNYIDIAKVIETELGVGVNAWGRDMACITTSRNSSQARDQNMS